MTYERPLSPGKYALQVADYLLLADAGAFGDSRTELIGGDVIVMSPQLLPHGLIKADLYDLLRDALQAIGSPLRVLSEVSLEIAPASMPMPDIMLVDRPRSQGRKAAQLGTVPLVIEVADSSLPEDLGPKRLLYAAAGISEYWVADVNGRVIHQFWNPAGETYARTREVGFGERISSTTVDGLAVETDGL